MIDQAEGVDDWQAYYNEIARRNEEHQEYINTYSARAYEYGVMALKNFTLVSGGGLLAIPAISAMAPDLAAKTAALSGFYFATSLVCCLLATYATHWNWMLNYHYREVIRQKDYNFTRDAFLPTLREEDWQDPLDIKIAKLFRKIKITFYMPHLLGLVGFVAFARACWVLYFGLKIIGGEI